jgi:hypothetical protein
VHSLNTHRKSGGWRMLSGDRRNQSTPQFVLAFMRLRSCGSTCAKHNRRDRNVAKAVARSDSTPLAKALVRGPRWAAGLRLLRSPPRGGSFALDAEARRVADKRVNALSSEEEQRARSPAPRCVLGILGRCRMRT